MKLYKNIKIKFFPLNLAINMMDLSSSSRITDSQRIDQSHLEIDTTEETNISRSSSSIDFSYTSFNDSVSSYTYRLAENNYLINDHLDLSICEVRLYQYKKLRKLLCEQIWISRTKASRSMSVNRNILLVELNLLKTLKI